jgi:hypothetical protein
MKALNNEDKRNQILKKYEYEIVDVEKISPAMWDNLMKMYPKGPKLTLDDLRDLKIIKITFIEGTACEIQSIRGSSSRMMVLPLNPYVSSQFSSIMSRVVVH